MQAAQNATLAFVFNYRSMSLWVLTACNNPAVAGLSNIKWLQHYVQSVSDMANCTAISSRL